MKTMPYLIFMLILFVGTSCSTYIINNLPTDYTAIHRKVSKKIENNKDLDKSLCDGQLLMLQIGNMLPGDTVSVYINDIVLLENITTDYPYPYICKEEYGGHGEHDYDFLLYKKKCGNKLLVVNLNDPQKNLIKQVKLKNDFRIKAIDGKGCQKEFVIPKNLDHFLEIRFLFFKDFYADTLRHIRFRE